MTIIYEPRDVVNIREALGGTIIHAGLLAAADFIVGDLKPWSFYSGVALGGMAAATGIPGAAATLYAIGDTVDALLFKSPDGSDVRIFLNGVAHSSVDTYALASVWEAVQVVLDPDVVNRIDIINFGPSADEDATGILWFGLGSITVNGSNAHALGVNHMPAIISLQATDIESDGRVATIPFYFLNTLALATYQGIVTALAPLVDANIGAQLTGASITLPLTLPGGIKGAPVADHYNERGGNILFATSGPYNDSIRLPAISTTVFGGTSVLNLEETEPAALIGWLTADQTINAETVRAKNRWDYNLLTAIKGTRSFRKR